MRDTNAEPILPAILRLAGPACLTFLLQNAYHLNDAFFLGRAGPVAANAMGLFMIVLVANFGFILMLARGTQSLVGRRFGAGSHEGSARALACGLGLAWKVALPLAVVEWIFAPQIIRLMGGRGPVVDVAADYLRTIILFAPSLFAAPMIDFAFQALGDTVTPMRLGCVAVLINFVLNAALVLDQVTVLGISVPTAGLGVIGAALATGVSRTVSPLLGFLILVKRQGLTPLLSRDSYRHDGRLVAEILRVGVPAGSATLLFAFVAMAVSQVIGRFGQDAYGAFGIGFRGVESVSFMIVLGLGAATGTVCAHAAGAGNFDRARRAGHVGAGLGVVAMGGTAAVMFAAPASLAGVYTHDAAIISIAVTYITTMAWCQVPQALEMIYGEAMAGAGSSFRTAVITIPGNILRVPLAWGLAVGLGWGLGGVWFAILASAVVKGLGVAALYRSGRWERAMFAGRKVVDAA